MSAQIPKNTSFVKMKMVGNNRLEVSMLCIGTGNDSHTMELLKRGPVYSRCVYIGTGLAQA